MMYRLVYTKYQCGINWIIILPIQEYTMYLCLLPVCMSWSYTTALLNLSSPVWLDTVSQSRPLVSILKKKHPTTGEGAPAATKHQKIQQTAERSPVERAPFEQSMYSVTVLGTL